MNGEHSPDNPCSVAGALSERSGCPYAAVYSRMRAGTGNTLLEAATSFFDLLEREPGGPGVDRARRGEVENDIRRHGFYEHSPDELLWGSRMAWRHSVRCVGRAFWPQLEMVDARACSRAEEVAQACIDHLGRATRGGRIQPLITIFAPERAGQGPRIWNYELVRYAGYQRAPGDVLGDPAEAGFTRFCIERMGWVPPESPSRFDVLPLVISVPGDGPRLFPVPRGAVLEVKLVHPEWEWFSEMNLRWYAVPVVSNMALEIGGIRYSAAPFNGWYMGTEIGARNLGDADRYNVLPEVACRMGIWEKKESSLWRDRALVEVNRAVLYSYQKAGVRMVDHHTVSDLHVQFEEQEKAAGRPVTGRWDWLVPPLSGCLSPLWSRPYDPTEYSPNFYPQTRPAD